MNFTNTDSVEPKLFYGRLNAELNKIEHKVRLEVLDAFEIDFFRWRNIYFPDIKMRGYLRHAFLIKRLIFRGGNANITQSDFADFFNSFAREDE